MAYKYLPILSTMFPSPSSTINQDILAGINDGFYETYDWYQIQEETTRGTGVCDKNVDVRINHTVSSMIGQTKGDDFKKLSFNGYHELKLGNIFYFSDNYWTIVNLEAIKSPTSVCTVRRCNNVLRWQDDDGGIQSWACAIDYEIARAMDASSSSGLTVLKGMIKVYLQLNSETSKIQANQRFLFGNQNNFVAYRITGGGINNYSNINTTDNESYGLLTLVMEATEKDLDNDDLVNGIANANKYTYAITINPSSFSGIATSTITLVPTVKLNGEVVTRTVTWTSDTPTKATVNATKGVVTLIATGTATIRCALANNTSVYADTVITIASSAPSNTYSIRISPTTNNILLGANQTYTASLYTNGTLDTDTFTFAIDTTSTAPITCYDFTTVDTTKFNVENLAMSIGKPIVIKVTSVSHSTTTQLFSINLKGAF